MFYAISKRTIDLIGALVLLVLFSPIFLLTAILIKLTSPGPILADVPKRLGRGGKPFHIYKFRSMIVNAHRLLRTDPKFRKAYKEFRGPKYKLLVDPRVTNIGKFIRKHSIDEIPQLMNVLIGDMSIVGPRPYYQEELEFQQKQYLDLPLPLA